MPLLSRLSPPANPKPSSETLAGYRRAQRLAFEAARHVAELVQPGWTEAQAATLLNQYLRDHGVRGFFHEAFAWFGDRTRFEGVRGPGYGAYAPTKRVLAEGEGFILDVAPIVEGFICDIGYTAGVYRERSRPFLMELRQKIPPLFERGESGAAIWDEVDRWIEQGGWDNIHQQYPFSVLGHRVHEVPGGGPPLAWWNFGWQSYWALMSRGVFGQLFNRQYEGSLEGLWAIEPHIGGQGFGAKFEEILVVDDNGAHWLDEPQW